MDHGTGLCSEASGWNLENWCAIPNEPGKVHWQKGNHKKGPHLRVKYFIFYIAYAALKPWQYINTHYSYLNKYICVHFEHMPMNKKFSMTIKLLQGNRNHIYLYLFFTGEDLNTVAKNVVISNTMWHERQMPHQNL